MTSISLIDKLKNSLSETNLQIVVSALRSDNLIWDYVNQSQLDLSQEYLQDDPEKLSPAALSLQSLEYPTNLDKLRSSPMQPVVSSYLKRVPEIKMNDSATLEQAGLLALQLRERRRKEGTWKELAGDLFSSPPIALTCLFGMIPDPSDLLKALVLPGETLSETDDLKPSSNSLAIKILLSNPLPREDQLDILSGLIEEMSPNQCQDFLSTLSNHRPELATYFVSNLLDQTRDKSHSCDELSSLENLVFSSNINRLADRYADETTYLNKSLEAASRLNASLSARLGTSASLNGDPETAISALEKSTQFAPESEEYLGAFLLALFDSNKLEEIEPHLASRSTGSPTHPTLLFAEALINTNQAQDSDNPKENLDNARKAANQALELLAVESGHSLDNLTLHNPVDLLGSLALLFLHLGQPGNAVRAAETMLDKQPNQPNHLVLLARSQYAAGEVEKALSNIKIAVALAPDQLNLRKQLVSSLEFAGEWEEALDQRTAILERIDDPSPSFMRSLASSALNADRHELAVQVCQKALQTEPDQIDNIVDASKFDDGKTLAVLGRAKAKAGDTQTAIDILKQATQVSPNYSEPWITLSQIYKETDLPQKSLEILQSAINAAPDQPQVYLALGESHLEKSTPTQALNVLNTASDLIEKKESSNKVESPRNITRFGDVENLLPIDLNTTHTHARVSFLLGQTLNQLGHNSKATEALEKAYKTIPTDPDISREYATSLIAENKLSKAVKPLETILNSKTADFDSYLDYARCILKLNKNQQGKLAKVVDENYHLKSHSIIPVIERALEIKPDHDEARALLAEALVLNNDLERSKKLFTEIMETDLTNDPAWKTRISLGLANASIELNENETAIAVLQDAVETDEGNPLIHRTMSEAYGNLGLSEDSYQSAKAALDASPDDLETLNWYAQQALHYKDNNGFTWPDAETDAVEALNHAIQIAPERSDIFVMLGQMQLDLGEHKASEDTLHKLLTAKISKNYSSQAVDDLYKASKLFNQLGNQESTIASLEQALNLEKLSEDENIYSYTNPRSIKQDILYDLASAQYRFGNLEESIGALNQAIRTNPSNGSLYIAKANLILEQKSPKNGLSHIDDENKKIIKACLKQAYDLNPDDPAVLFNSALLERIIGDLPASLMHAEKSVDLLTHSDDQQVTPKGTSPSVNISEVRTLAADTSRALIQQQRANILLSPTNAQMQKGAPGRPENIDDSSIICDYHCSQAEQALQAGNISVATKYLSAILETDPDNPRVLAIQSQLNGYKHNQKIAHELFQQASRSPKLSKTPASSVHDEFLFQPKTSGASQKIKSQFRWIRSQLSIVEAAIQQNQWDMAEVVIKKALASAPHEPNIHLQLARIKVLRAEFQRLCEATDLIKLAPGKSSLNEKAHLSCKESIQAAKRLINKWQTENTQEALDEILRWDARCAAVFQPSHANAKRIAATSPNQEDIAAMVASLCQSEEAGIAGNIARGYPNNPYLLTLLALSNKNDNYHKAISTLRAAAELLDEEQSTNTNLSDVPPYVRGSILTAINQYTLAKVIHSADANSIETTDALNSIKKALSILPDEPRWHYLAGEIHIKNLSHDAQADHVEPIHHLENSIEMEPDYLPSYLKLGELHINDGNTQAAIETLDRVVQLEPDNPDGWMSLAQALRSGGNIPKAAEYAQKSAKLAPEDNAPVILLGEIALQENNPQETQDLAQKALNNNPDDTNAQLLLVRALKAMDKPQDAMNILKDVTSLANDPLPLMLEQARLVSLTKGKEAGLESLQNIAKDYPDDPNVLANIAENFDEAGNVSQAIKTAQHALRIGTSPSSSQPFSKQVQMHRMLGRLLSENGNLDQSVHHFSEAIRLAPYKIESYIELGEVQKTRRLHAEALDTYQKAISASPKDPRPYYYAGQTLKESKDYLSAESMLRQAQELAPDDVNIHRLLGAVVALNLVHNRSQSHISV